MHTTFDPLASVADRVLEALEEPFDWWTNERFHALAIDLAHAQHATIPAVGAWWSATQPGDIDRIESWHEVPLLPVEAFKTLTIGRQLTTPAATWQSSGTSGRDQSKHQLERIDEYESALRAGAIAALLPDVATGTCPPLTCIQLQPSGSDAPASSLSHMFDVIRTSEWCNDAGAHVSAQFELDSDTVLAELAAACRDERPVLVLATSFALAMLLDALQDRGERLQLPPASRIVDTGGYKGRTRQLTRTELLARVEHYLGVSSLWCENEYGMSEMSSQGWLGTVARETGHALAPTPPLGCHWVPPWCRMRVIDPESLTEVPDGETGLIAVVDLANVWSCAFLRTEDLGRRHGSHVELLGRAPGATLKGCSLQLESLGVRNA